MRDIAVYKAEREAGLETVIRSTASLKYHAIAVLDAVHEAVQLSEKTIARVRDRVKANASGQPDLHYLNTILVTTGWNLNDDVFDKGEVWAARHSPEHKPFNYEHIGDDIIGHITASKPVDTDYNPIDQASVVDDLPSKYHLLTAAVLYKFWEDEALQERMDTILTEIAKGMWYVSMESLFTGFDYAIIRPDKTVGIVARGEKTAFLTKHLRAYGGNGVYDKYKVGRMLRNITFSGKGLVRKPANPESIIFQQTEEFDSSTAEFVTSVAELGYSVSTRNSSHPCEERKTAMAADNESLEVQNKNLKHQVETLQASLTEKAKAEQVAFANQVKVLDDKVATLNSTVVAAEQKATMAEADAKAWKAKAEEAQATAAAAKAEVEKLASDKKKTARVAILVKALDADEAKATKMAEDLSGLSDEAFESHANYLSEKLAEYKKALPSGTQAGDNGGTDAKPQVKEIPKATDKPAPMGGKAPKVKTLGNERDKAAANADKVDLEAVVDGGTPALAAGGEDASVEKTRADIVGFMAEFLGIPEEAEAK